MKWFDVRGFEIAHAGSVNDTTEVEVQLVSHKNVFDTVLVTPSSQGVAIRTQEDSPWAFDEILFRLNAYSNASYKVILTS